jgi:hypothetical protein
MNARQSFDAGTRMALASGTRHTHVQTDFVCVARASPVLRDAGASSLTLPRRVRPQLFPHLGQRVFGLASPRGDGPVSFLRISLRSNQLGGNAAQDDPQRLKGSSGGLLRHAQQHGEAQCPKQRNQLRAKDTEDESCPR